MQRTQRGTNTGQSKVCCRPEGLIRIISQAVGGARYRALTKLITPWCGCDMPSAAYNFLNYIHGNSKRTVSAQSDSSVCLSEARSARAYLQRSISLALAFHSKLLLCMQKIYEDSSFTCLSRLHGEQNSPCCFRPRLLNWTNGESEDFEQN
jgi:hypothetical protein